MTTNERIAEFMDAISEHSVLVAPAPDGTILVTDAGETLIATPEGWKPWDPEHDIRCWHGEHGILAKIEEMGLDDDLFQAWMEQTDGAYALWDTCGECRKVAWAFRRAEAPQLAEAFDKVIEEERP
jgi:hypothetical protein